MVKCRIGFKCKKASHVCVNVGATVFSMTCSCGTTYGSIRNTDTFLFVISATNVFACEILKSVMFFKHNMYIRRGSADYVKLFAPVV